MERLIKEFNTRLKELNSLVEKSNAQIKKYSNYKDIRVHSCMSNGRSQFYYVDNASQRKIFIKANDLKNYIKYFQRDYDMAVNKKLLKIQKKLTRVTRDLQEIDFSQIKEIYQKQAPSKKSYITPLIETDEAFIARWYEENQGGKNTYPIEGNIYTSKGEHVRSKSEKILADLFEKYDIPYVYEPMLKLNNGHVVSPDFALLNTRQRKTIYWEHLGLIDQEEYAVKNLLKLQSYEDSGIVLGENLFISMESTKQWMNTKIVEMYIKNMFL